MSYRDRPGAVSEPEPAEAILASKEAVYVHVGRLKDGSHVVRDSAGVLHALVPLQRACVEQSSLQADFTAVQAGKTLEVKLRAATPGGDVLDGPAVAFFFGPGKDPEHDPAAREPDLEAELIFDPATRLHCAEVPTDGWAPGTWTVQGRTIGPPAGWAFYRFAVEE